MYEPDDRKILPLKVEPLSIEVTTKPFSGETDAVTEPLTILLANCASGAKAALGILNNCSPLPDMNEPDDKKTFPMKVEPLSIEVTTNPLSGDTDAVTEPLTMRLAN